jgi:hypothetical protein
MLWNASRRVEYPFQYARKHYNWTGLRPDWLVEVVAKSIRCNHEENVEFFTIAFVDAGIGNVYAICFELPLDDIDVVDANRRALLRGVTTVYGKTDLDAVAFKYDGWMGTWGESQRALANRTASGQIA